MGVPDGFPLGWVVMVGDRDGLNEGATLLVGKIVGLIDGSNDGR